MRKSPMDPQAHYRESRDRARGEEEAVRGRARRISHLRTGAFLLAAAPLLLLETTDRALWPHLLIWAALAAAAFLVLVRHHRSLRRLERRWGLRRRIGDEGLARLDRSWDRIPDLPMGEVPESHPSAPDLDLVGRASLLHLLTRATTGPGRALLRSWILDPLAGSPERAAALLEEGGDEGPRPTHRPGPGWRDAVLERQAAVRRLAGESAFREELELAGREVAGRERPRAALAFLRWAAAPPWLRDRRWIRASGALLGAGVPAAIVLWLLGLVPGILPVAGGLAALALHRQVAGEAAARLDAAEAGEGALERWAALFHRLEELPGGEEAPLLARLKGAARTPEPGAARALRRLRRIVDTAGVRRSGLTHLPLVVLFSWDVHMLAWLERWQERHGRDVEGWILALAEVEALTSLAGLSHDHPEWGFPGFTGDDPAAHVGPEGDGAGQAMERGIQARELGHPLLPPARCVPNDVEVPPPGSLLLVTGSNMAGKTTLLRALGTNQILALAGGPVAARELRTPPILPWTAMRVRDSLVGGVSYFLAGLERLRELVAAAREGPVLYLLDEILEGTNTAERRTAARIVLGHLLETRSVGAVTTHDLTLADSPALRPRLVQVHFREEVRESDGRKELDFDYRLRPGPATSRNALLLLEMVGLGPAEGDDEEAGPTP